MPLDPEFVAETRAWLLSALQHLVFCNQAGKREDVKPQGTRNPNDERR
jgi:hypothetical protein